jgi:hypothetical protein
MEQAGWGSVDLVPLRVNPSLSDEERNDLKEKWKLLYQSQTRPLTPFGVSASSPEIIPYMQVGLLPERSQHITEFGGVKDFIGDPLRWVGTKELLERESSSELATVMTGASPHGIVAALNAMIEHSWGIGGATRKRRLPVVRKVAKMMT